MRNIALRLMYVGTAYHGWQVQKNAETVAETLEKSLASVVGHPVKCTGAGRTDAGQFPHHLPHPLRPDPPGGEHPPARRHRGGEGH